MFKKGNRAGDLITLAVLGGVGYWAISSLGRGCGGPSNGGGIRTISGVALSAYSSNPRQTDLTPFITASNTRVRDGIVACNWIPPGVQIEIQEIPGKVFVVEDRMSANYEKHPRNVFGIDRWMKDSASATQFGVMYGVTVHLLNASVEKGDGRWIFTFKKKNGETVRLFRVSEGIGKDRKEKWVKFR